MQTLWTATCSNFLIPIRGLGERDYYHGMENHSMDSINVSVSGAARHIPFRICSNPSGNKASAMEASIQWR